MRRSILVERAASIERLRAAEDPAADPEPVREETPTASRRKLRDFRRMEVAASLTSDPTPSASHHGAADSVQEPRRVGYALTALAEVLSTSRTRSAEELPERCSEREVAD